MLHLQLPAGKDEFAIMLTQDYVAALRRSKAAALQPPASSSGSPGNDLGGSSAVAAGSGGQSTAAAQQAAQVRSRRHSLQAMLVCLRAAACFWPRFSCLLSLPPSLWLVSSA